MLSAHGADGGPNFEALVLALPMLVVGVILFVQKSAQPIVPVLLVLGGIAIGGAGMTVLDGDDHDGEGSKVAPTSSYVGTVTGLCEAGRLAPSRPEEAAALFQDQAHVDLHDLAAEVEESDRAAAAALLEAKQAVEADIEADQPDGERLEQDLDELLDAAVAGLRELDVEAPTC